MCLGSWLEQVRRRKHHGWNANSMSFIALFTDLTWTSECGIVTSHFIGAGKQVYFFQVNQDTYHTYLVRGAPSRQLFMWQVDFWTFKNRLEFIRTVSEGRHSSQTESFTNRPNCPFSAVCSKTVWNLCARFPKERYRSGALPDEHKSIKTWLFVLSRCLPRRSVKPWGGHAIPLIFLSWILDRFSLKRVIFFSRIFHSS